MNNAEEARRMLRAHRYGALSTLSKKFDGFPFGSIAPYMVDHDGSLLILISALAEHTKNIQHDPRVSLLTHDQRDPHIQTQGRVTLLGNAQHEPDRERAGQRYLRYFPEAQAYFAMHDFAFFRIQPTAIRFIGGFGRIHWVGMENYAVTDAAAFAQREDALLAAINAKSQHALNRLLQQRHGVDATTAQAVGIDCDGVDVYHAEQTWRLDFPETADLESLETSLARLLTDAQ
ncbi:MAG TPA: pyridoxamine 5'-phosphate oxidase family protein [Gallionella sp.]|nr:pyridoxamine 5'-phosphate oxidase family protein [Gallionella sp.]